jgi:hypothetical protein
MTSIRSTFGDQLPAWADDGSEPEVPLLGGDVTEGLVRVGATVRRPVQANSKLVHALLRHLEDVGFTGAPRFLGIDNAGREVLTYIEGEVAGRPRPAWIADEDRLASVGRLVRAYDDAARRSWRRRAPSRTRDCPTRRASRPRRRTRRS